MRLYFLSVMMLLALRTAAQGNPEAGFDIDRFNKLRGWQQPPAVRQPLPERRGTALSGAEYAGSNNRGDIFILPQDNMPMLKPHQAQYNTIPLARLEEPPYGTDTNGRIPNPLAPPPGRFRWQQVQPR